MERLGFETLCGYPYLPTASTSSSFCCATTGEERGARAAPMRASGMPPAAGAHARAPVAWRITRGRSIIFLSFFAIADECSRRGAISLRAPQWLRSKRSWTVEAERRNCSTKVSCD